MVFLNFLKFDFYIFFSAASGNGSSRIVSGESSGSLAICASAAAQARARAGRSLNSENPASSDTLVPGHSRGNRKFVNFEGFFGYIN